MKPQQRLELQRVNGAALTYVQLLVRSWTGGCGDALPRVLPECYRDSYEVFGDGVLCALPMSYNFLPPTEGSESEVCEEVSYLEPLPPDLGTHTLRRMEQEVLLHPETPVCTAGAVVAHQEPLHYTLRTMEHGGAGGRRGIKLVISKTSSAAAATTADPSAAVDSAHDVNTSDRTTSLHADTSDRTTSLHADTSDRTTSLHADTSDRATSLHADSSDRATLLHADTLDRSTLLHPDSSVRATALHADTSDRALCADSSDRAGTLPTDTLDSAVYVNTSDGAANADTSVRAPDADSYSKVAALPAPAVLPPQLRPFPVGGDPNHDPNPYPNPDPNPDPNSNPNSDPNPNPPPVTVTSTPPQARTQTAQRPQATAPASVPPISQATAPPWPAGGHKYKILANYSKRAPNRYLNPHLNNVL